MNTESQLCSLCYCFMRGVEHLQILVSMVGFYLLEPIASTEGQLYIFLEF